MSQWIDRIKTHPIWAALDALGPVIDQAVAREDITAESVDGLERLRAVLAFTGKRLTGLEPVIATVEPLNDITSALNTARAQVTAFIGNGDASHVGNANGAADSLLANLARNSVPLTPDDTGALKDAATAYRATLESHLKTLEESFGKVGSEIAALKARLTEVAEETTKERQRISSLASDYQTAFAASQESRAKEHSDAQAKRQEAAAEFQSQFSAAQETRAKAHTDAQTQRQEALSAILTEYQTKLTEQNAEFSRRRDEDFKTHAEHVVVLTEKYESVATGILKDIASKKSDVEKLVGVIGNLGVTSGYLKAAKSAARQKWFWQSVTVLSLSAMILIAVYAFLPALDHGARSLLPGGENTPTPFSWPGFAARVVITLTVGVLAAYASSQADKNLESERRNRKFALELEAIGPYLAPLPVEQQNTFRVSLGDRSFGRDDVVVPQKSSSPANLFDLTTEQLTRIAELIKAIRQ